ncbi:MAG: HAD-IC family P-type ATPase [Clostridia bacterium]|nr:HAD-IC family P-type ATPase [Clostridia bacterium]
MKEKENTTEYTSEQEKQDKHFLSLFPKQKEKKQKRKKPSMADIVRYHPTVKDGLNTSQINERIQSGLINTGGKKYSKSYLSIFVGNICTGFNLICALAAIALLMARAEYTQFLFVLIFAINIAVGIIFEIRAKRKLDKLSILSAPMATVIRNGRKMEISTQEIVLDDVLVLTAGQQIPADCIALEGMAEVNESLLTGESVPIKKEPESLLYAGSFMASGQIIVRVDKIGEDTYISKLTSRAKTYKRPNSEIMNSISLFIKMIGLLIIPIAILMFMTNYEAIGGSWEELEATGGFLGHLFAGGDTLCKTIQKTASVVIGMIPSGLLLLTTAALTMGILNLARYNTLVQDIYSLEMLARVNVLCLDKTGTITDGRMKVSDCILLNATGEHSVDNVIGSMLASLSDNNQTSIALYERFGHSSALSASATLPFSSARKFSAVTFEEAGTYVLGAPEFVLKPVPARIDKIVKQYAQMGLRVLVLAHSPSPLQGDKVPTALRSVAIITLADNIRPDAIETIKWFKENDVNVKVISGDNPVTVSEVARRAGIKNASQYLSLEGLSNIEVENAANQYTVFGRVTPEQKAILVRAIKKAGNTVAMTGDGVNDILAMKEADCAISVASGSEAARNVSNLVLQDNNFGSMPKVVYEGRRVINNVKNSASLYIMKTLLILILAVTCIFLKSEYFFKTNNMLMFEFLISAIPSFFLSLQPNTNRVKGKFIPYVLSRAMPGSITMAMGIISLYVLHKTPLANDFGLVNSMGEDTPIYHALMMLVLTFCGLVMLFRICQPFNLYRTILFAGTALLCIAFVSIPYLGNIVFTNWDQLEFTLEQLLLVIIIIQAAFPISSFLIKAFDLMNPAEE